VATLSGIEPKHGFVWGRVTWVISNEIA